jgi:sulfur carrier protein
VSVEVTVNGEAREVPAGTTVAELVAAVTRLTAGVAAAVNGEVVPRRCWPGTQLRAGDQVEVVTAVQGG